MYGTIFLVPSSKIKSSLMHMSNYRIYSRENWGNKYENHYKIDKFKYYGVSV